MRHLSRSNAHRQRGECPLPSEADLDQFRALLGDNTTIPASFEEFLRTYNGGTFDECVFEETEEGPVVVSTFFPVSGSADESISRQLGYFQETVGDGYIPFADDPGGNYFLIGCSPDNAGVVFFWNHATHGMFEVSKSFSEFIDRLALDH